MEAPLKGIRDAVAGAAALLLLAAAIYAIGIGEPGLFAVTLAAGVLGAFAWRQEQRRLGARLGDIEQRSAELDAARADAESARQAAERAERHSAEKVDRMKQELDHERHARMRVERARKAEHDWNRELRDQVVRAHRESGTLGDSDDVRALVLHIAVTLVGAQKGLLLSRKDDNHDGKLDFVCAEGFDNDPRESAIAQRFAGEVIAEDQTVKEDAGAVDEENSTAADREIENIVAIPIYIQDEFSGAVICANRDGGFEELDDDVLLALGNHAGAVLENGRLRGELRTAYLATVTTLAEAIEAKDPFLRGHSDEVSRYVAAVADQMGMEPRRREELIFGSLLHDVGKIGISERILLKPAPLTPEERNVINLHPRIGFRLVEHIPALRPIAPAILHHHERYDGDGYPSKLAGDAIPLEARIICVADSFSAMTAERPYRRRMSLEDACAELERCAGTQFDPDVVRIFCDEVRKHPIADDRQTVADALRDPAIEAGRDGDEPLLGFGSLAVTDNLTLLYSHRYFHEVAESEAQSAAASGGPFGVVLAELTELPQVNQIDGYPAGDEAIRMAARALQRCAVRCGGTACRYSGRRLAMVVPGVDQSRAEDVAAELIASLADGPRVAVGAAAWREGDSGADVAARARLALAPAPAV
jgi:diguanylate cyclase (GGDEF)-like protein